MSCTVGAGFAVFAALAIGGAAQAGAQKCAKPKEVTAIQAAAVQQELMVAALACHDTANFNTFQTSFNRELRASDGTLLGMFHRLYGYHRGEIEYHAFKTRLANDSSMRAIHNSLEYCQEASTAFSAALSPDKPTLAAFVDGVKVTQDSPVDSCEIRVAPGLNGPGIPKVMPRPNPVRLAQNDPAPPPDAPAADDAPAAPDAPPADDQAAQAPEPGVLPPENSTADPAQPPSAPPPATDAANNPPQQQPEKKKDSGWLSGLTDWF